MSIRHLIAFSVLALSISACSSKTVQKDEPLIVPAGAKASAAKAGAKAESRPDMSEPLAELNEMAPKGERSDDKEDVAGNMAGDDADEKDYLCKKPNDERWLQIDRLEDKGCKLWYTRDTGKKAVAWSSSSKDHCRKSRDKMIDRLEGQGFECKPE